MSPKDKALREYRTRFAPSPTGPLHFGSLTTAVGSYLQAHKHHGQWLIRVEDIDGPRQVKGAIEDQLETLASFGLKSQGPVTQQSAHEPRHRAVIQALVDQGLAYPCACSSKMMPPDGRYPGTCRAGLPEGKTQRSIRLKCSSEVIHFIDLIQGAQQQNPEREVGDFVIRRGDGLIAYQLAVVVDDIDQGITEVVRGADLLSSVGRQILLYQALGAEPPRYCHLPVVVDQQGRKLSKSDQADPISRYNRSQTLRLALRALGHEPPVTKQSLEAQWTWAFGHWSIDQVPKGPVSF